MIRIASVDHRDLDLAERIRAVQARAYAQEAALLGVSDFPPARRTAEEIRAGRERFLVAMVGDVIVGALGVEDECIASLVVVPEHQRRGIGRALVARALFEIGPGPVTVSTGAANRPALALYASFGFVESGRRLVGTDALEVIDLRRA